MSACIFRKLTLIGRKGYCILFCFFTFKIRSCSLGDMPYETSYRVWAYLHYSIPGYNLRTHFAVYIKVAVDWRCGSGIGHYRQPNTMMYIGSTGVSVTLREANRMSVLRKLERSQEAQAELAIRYWHQNSCFQQFTL